MTKLWRIYCDEATHPGQWLQWFRYQCAAFGWPPNDGYKLLGDTQNSSGWSAVRNVLPAIKHGDWVVISLPGNRVARMGEVYRLQVKDEDWSPLVRPSRAYPSGENGRRILLRWDMTAGPDDREKVVLLPSESRFQPGYEITGTIRPIESISIDRLREVMSDPGNWVPLVSTFDKEKALSDYIAAYPHRLEDGMIRHPSQSVREKTFPDRTRTDVILQDREERTVIVECKQGAPTASNLEQLRRYMAWMKSEFPEFGSPRGVLVHGGSRRVHPHVMRMAEQGMEIELVYHQLHVDFMSSDSNSRK